jgi:glyoxylase-like metal-dependent hydrolase (beta-lactamase superfamily II)
VQQLVVTHAHPDHVMAIPLLRELFPGAALLASAPAAATLAAEKAIAFFRQVDAALTGALGLGDQPPAAPAAAPNPFAVDRIVREGDRLAIEDSAWTVLETPGHSECSISLHNAARRVLIISDATGYYLPDRQAWWPNYFSDYPAYLRSMERLGGLEAEVLCLSHNGAIRGADAVRNYFAGAAAATRGYHQRIVAEASSGQNARQIAEQLGVEAHALAPVLPVEFFQKNCGLLVKQSLKVAAITPEK